MINKKTSSTQPYPYDYQIVYADEFLSLIKVTSLDSAEERIIQGQENNVLKSTIICSGKNSC